MVVPTVTIYCFFGPRLADEASASSLHTAPNNLRSIGQVNGSAVLRCAPALRVILPACCSSGRSYGPGRSCGGPPEARRAPGASWRP